MTKTKEQQHQTFHEGGSLPGDFLARYFEKVKDILGTPFNLVSADYSQAALYQSWIEQREESNTQYLEKWGIHEGTRSLIFDEKEITVQLRKDRFNDTVSVVIRAEPDKITQTTICKLEKSEEDHVIRLTPEFLSVVEFYGFPKNQFVVEKITIDLNNEEPTVRSIRSVTECFPGLEEGTFQLVEITLDQNGRIFERTSKPGTDQYELILEENSNLIPEVLLGRICQIQEKQAKKEVF